MTGERRTRLVLQAVVAIVGSAVQIIVAVVINLVTDDSPPSWLVPVDQYAVPVLLVGGIVSALIAVLPAVAAFRSPEKPEKRVLNAHDRRVLLGKVSGELEQLLSVERDDPSPLASAVGVGATSVASRTVSGSDPGEDLVDAYRRSATLALLGEVGSGKTRMLVQLATALCATAKNDPSAPIPIICQLGMWRPGGSIHDLAIAVISTNHGVPIDQATWLVTTNGVVLLLDGLDEAVNQEQCVEKINSFRRSYGLNSFVVTCRHPQATNEVMCLDVDAFVAVLPPPRHEIERYLGAVGSSVEEFRRTTGLHGAGSSSPLLLNLYVRAMRGRQSRVALEVDSRGDFYRFYVESMLSITSSRVVRPGIGEFPPAESIWWLGWLAASMRSAGIIRFTPGRAQPARLLEIEERRVVLRDSRFVAAGLAGGLTGALYFLAGGLTTALVAALLIVGVVLLFSRRIDTVHYAERVLFSWPGLSTVGRSVLRTLKLSVPFGVLTACIGAVIFGHSLFSAALFGAVLGQAWGLLFGAVDAVMRTGVNPRDEHVPRPGWHLVAISLAVATLMAAMAGSVFFLFISASVSWWFVAFCTWTGVLGYLDYGGFALIVRFRMRLLIWGRGFAPWRLGKFLDFAARRAIMRKVGSGYEFYHLELRDALARTRR